MIQSVGDLKRSDGTTQPTSEPIMKTYTLCLCVLLLGGCSNEPTSDDFRRFLDTETARFNGPRVAEDGVTVTWDVALETYDLRRTESLTSPLQGTATWKGTSEHAKPDERKTTIPMDMTVNYGWIEDGWEILE